MKNSQYIIYVFLLLGICLAGCEKLPLKKSPEYKTSLYDDQLHMSVMQFIESRDDLFIGLRRAILYVAEDPQYSDVKALYERPVGENTFLLLSNNALIDIQQSDSFFSKNLKIDEDPESPTYGELVPGVNWSQYDREEVAEMLKYHVLKGKHDYQTTNSTPKWVDTYALSPTNDTAKVYIYLSQDREGSFLLNHYTTPPVSPTLNIVPRTPNLHATNGVVQVMDRYILQPTKEAIENN